MTDAEIVRLLHQLSRPTFFTLDRDYYSPKLLHAGYCLVFLDVAREDSAHYIRRLLRHSAFGTVALRLGTIIEANRAGLRFWRLHVETEHHLNW